MYIYRVVLDGYNSRAGTPGARVLTYTQGHSRADAMRRLGTVYVARDGSVSDGFDAWPGSNKLPNGPYTARSLPEYEIVSIRSVGKRGTPRLLDTSAVSEAIRTSALGVEITVTRSGGSDGAVVVFIDTEFEPDGTGGGPGLRVMINDDIAYEGKPYVARATP